MDFFIASKTPVNDELKAWENTNDAERHKTSQEVVNTHLSESFLQTKLMPFHSDKSSRFPVFANKVIAIPTEVISISGFLTQTDCCWNMVMKVLTSITREKRSILIPFSCLYWFVK